jgi:glycosyltransferase involved in cell wall biosynthesis
MTHQPLVSIIIPFLNAEKFLQEAIESVFAQTYQNWELLLVDDGSTDRSSEIALRYVEHPTGKARYFEHPRHENRGTCASRNLGIRYSAGEYIALLDADDVWLPEKLKDQVAILGAHPEVGMVYGATQYWNSWTGDLKDRQSDYTPKLGVATEAVLSPPTLLTLSLESKAPTPCPSDILLRRNLVTKIGGFEESFRGIYQLFEDQVFLAKVYLETPVFVAARCWDKYRLHADSCVSVVNHGGHKRRVGLFYLKWLSSYLTDHGVKNVELWQALRKKRLRYRYAALSHWVGRAQLHIRDMRRSVQVITRQRTALIRHRLRLYRR